MDLEYLANKVEDGGETQEGMLAAEEWNTLVREVIDLKESNNILDKSVVKSIRQGATTYLPVDGQVILPGADTQVTILTTASTTKIVSATGKMIIPIAVTSVEGGSDTSEIVKLVVQLYSQGEWVDKAEMTIPSTPFASPVYRNIDITDYISSGDQTVRFVATGLDTTVTGRLQFASVVLTKLEVQFASDYNQPVRGDTLSPYYYIYGSGVEKTLHVKVTGDYGSRQNDYNVGTSTYTINPFTGVSFNDPETESVKLLTHGVRQIEAWVSCDDGSGGELESEHIYNSLMIVADEADTTPYLMLQNFRSNAVNYEQLRLLSYAIYNPLGNTLVAISITDYSGLQEYMRLEQEVAPQTKMDVDTTIEVEDTVNDSFYVYFHFYRYDGDTQIDFLFESYGESIKTIIVDNKDKFSPTEGKDFFLNPKVRNNTETNPASIINSAKNNEEVESEFKGFGFTNDGWVTAEDGNKVLRILAGQELRIGYEPFKNFISSSANSMTLEMVVKVRNVTDEETPIIRVCSDVAATGDIIGLSMSPMTGYLMTLSKTTKADQNFSWQENERTHIAINIVHALRSSPTSQNTISLVRVFINNNIYREFQFDTEQEGEFVSALGHGGIIIGQHEADIDIYSLGCYQKALSTDEIRRNYESTLPTSNEKRAYRSKNDILQNGEISYALASQKYNCLVWHGVEVSHNNQASQTGWLEVSMLNADGSKDKEHSGTICKETRSLPAKGQGSTAKTYFDWNQQWDVNKSKGKIMVDGNEVGDGWIDGNGTYRGMVYRLTDDIPDAEKLVLKINYASSMQSHKQGATELYNLLHTSIVGANSMQLVNPKARVTVLERPFLFFVQGDADAEPVFRGLGTFGPGKMDKKTWGYDKKKFPDFAMMEGSDNNKPLTDMRVPWDDKVTYNVDEEYFEYAGDGNIDFDAGVTDDNDAPAETIVSYYRNAWNFLFMHNPRITPYINGSQGNLTNFLLEPNKDTSKQYWMTSGGGGANIYDVYRYDFADGQWVKAGLPVDGVYVTKNLLEIYPTALTSISAGDWDGANDAFIRAIVADAKSNIGAYFNVNSLKFHYAFVVNLLAGTDNCSKNTYYVLDPLTHLIEMHADDLDTILLTDNSGYQIKPYYIDRAHPYDEAGKLLYTEGGNNVLCNLCQLMWEDSLELASMMNTILNAMTDLITSEDQSKGIEKSAWGAFQKYMFSIQEYFPDVAYNETARIRYEYPASLGFVSDRNVYPIAQSLGSQLEAEKQYMKRRLVYFSSYAAYGEFSLNGDNGFGFQSYPRIDGTSPTIEMDITPHQYLYPTARVGQTLRNPHVRVAPGETYHFVIDNSGNLGDTLCGLKGANYYRSFGNLGDISVNPSLAFQIKGERLVEIVVNPVNAPDFRPSSLEIIAPLVKTISLKDSSLIKGQLNLSSSTRLVSADLRNTQITQVRLPASELLTTLQFGSYMTAVNIDNVPNLTTMTFTGYDYLSSIVVGSNVGSLDTLSVLIGCFNASAPLSVLSLRNIDWVDVNGDVLNYLLGVQNTSLTGSISTYEVGNLPTVTFDMKMAIINKFGNVDDISSEGYRGLKMTYTIRPITSVSINGEAYTHEAPKVYPYKLVPANAYQNGFQKITWGASAPAYGAECSMDPKTGELTVTKLSVLTDIISVNCNIIMIDGSLMVSSKEVGLYDRPAALGDYVFADGSYSDVDDKSKTAIGLCCFIGDEGNGDYILDKQKRLCVSMANLAGTGVDTKGNSVVFNSFQWGLFYNNKASGDAYEIPFADTKYSLQDDPEYNMYDLSSILNITLHGLPEGNTITDALYLDENEADGFKKFQSNRSLGDGFHYQGAQTDNDMSVQIKARTLTAELAALAGSGYIEGDVVNSAYIKTLKIIAHRNKILQDSKFSWVGAIPQAHGNTSEFQDLLNGMAEVRRYAKEDMGEANYEKWSQFFYPAASAAYAYQPSVKAGEELADKFKAHNWFLPANGHLGRMYWYSKLAPAEKNIFAKAIADGKFTDFAATGYWPCTELSQGYAWNVYFASGYTNLNDKCNTMYSRALAAF